MTHNDCDYCEMQDHRRATTVAMMLSAFSGFIVGVLVCWAF